MIAVAAYQLLISLNSSHTLTANSAITSRHSYASGRRAHHQLCHSVLCCVERKKAEKLKQKEDKKQKGSKKGSKKGD